MAHLFADPEFWVLLAVVVFVIAVWKPGKRAIIGAIDSRGQPGIYPGFGPRKLYEIEMEALRSHPDCPVLWEAASGSNQSLARAAFLQSGGFHPDISINEHRELALRLCQNGLRMASSSGRTYHMTHRSGWRDPAIIKTNRRRAPEQPGLYFIRRAQENPGSIVRPAMQK